MPAITPMHARSRTCTRCSTWAAGKIIRIDDLGVVPIPPDPGPIRRPQQREDLREIAITQPDGPSFEVDGYRVRWHDWELQVGFRPARWPGAV